MVIAAYRSLRASKVMTVLNKIMNALFGMLFSKALPAQVPRNSLRIMAAMTGTHGRKANPR